MEEIAVKKPFNEQEEKEAYKKYKQSGKYVKYGDEEIPVEYKDANNKTNKS